MISAVAGEFASSRTLKRFAVRQIQRTHDLSRSIVSEILDKRGETLIDSLGERYNSSIGASRLHHAIVDHLHIAIQQ